MHRESEPMLSSPHRRGGLVWAVRIKSWSSVSLHFLVLRIMLQLSRPSLLSALEDDGA